MKYIYSIIVVLAIVVFFTSSVQAQGSACLPIAKKEQFLKNIIEKYREVKIFTGLSRKGGYILELYFNPESTTFTVIATNTTHICAMDFGEGGDFKLVVPEKKKDLGA
jgi:hypothetical protein|tara:strand:- start:1564 stop:1887 length:324 start_codon:yes stop_codon:yes gene_type:complete